MITVERHVRAEPDRVWGFVGRVADWAELLPTITEVAPEPGAEPPGVGSRYAIRQPGLSRLVYEVTEWVPGHRFTWVAEAGGVRTVATHAVEPAPDGSLLLLTVAWTGALGRLVELLFGRRTLRYVQREAQTFAQLAEE